MCKALKGFQMCLAFRTQHCVVSGDQTQESDVPPLHHRSPGQTWKRCDCNIYVHVYVYNLIYFRANNEEATPPRKWTQGLIVTFTFILVFNETFLVTVHCVCGSWWDLKHTRTHKMLSSCE